MTDPSLGVLAWCSLAMLLGGTVKGVLGVGFPLLAVPMMSLAVPTVEAAALVTVPVVFSNLWQAREGGSLRLRFGRYWPLVAMLFAGTALGAWGLATWDARWSKLVLAAVVLAFVGLRITRPHFHVAPAYERPAGAAAGFLGGVIGGTTVMFGPVIIMYMSALRLPRDEFVGSIALIYLLGTAAFLIAFSSFGHFTRELLTASAIAVVPVGAGLAIGRSVRARIRQQVFERALLAVLVVIGANLLYRATVSPA